MKLRFSKCQNGVCDDQKKIREYQKKKRWRDYQRGCLLLSIYTLFPILICIFFSGSISFDSSFNVMKNVHVKATFFLSFSVLPTPYSLLPTPSSLPTSLLPTPFISTLPPLLFSFFLIKKYSLTYFIFLIFLKHKASKHIHT